MGLLQTTSGLERPPGSLYHKGGGTLLSFRGSQCTRVQDLYTQRSISASCLFRRCVQN